MQRIRCRTDEGGRIVYRDYNNPKERKALKEALTRTICNAEQKEQEDLTVPLLSHYQINMVVKQYLKSILEIRN